MLQALAREKKSYLSCVVPNKDNFYIKSVDPIESTNLYF
jgi:hypothetical protein